MLSELKTFFYKTKYFSLLFLIFWLSSIILWAVFPKGWFNIFFNSFSSSISDSFFSLITYLGNAWGVVLVLVFLFVFKIAKGRIPLLLAFLFNTLVVQSFKWVIFTDMPRPKVFFQDRSIALDYIQGLDIHAWGSFPSGHTSTVFLLAAWLCFYFIPKHFAQMLCLFIAMLVGISRIYLHQHFLEDVIFGSLIGVFSILFAVMVWKK